MRKSDCQEIQLCHCDCHNCIQYKSNKKQNRESLIMFYVKGYLSKTTEEGQADIKNVAKIFLTKAEYNIFTFEISGQGI